jgi:hypothetical protein
MNSETDGAPADPFALSLSKPPASSLAEEEGGSSTGSSERAEPGIFASLR